MSCSTASISAPTDDSRRTSAPIPVFMSSLIPTMPHWPVWYTWTFLNSSGSAFFMSSARDSFSNPGPRRTTGMFGSMSGTTFEMTSAW